MRLFVTFVALAAAAVVVSAQSGSFYDLKTKTLLGKDANLAQYRGKVSLVVNVASKCGFTPQYEGLEKLQREMKGKPFNVLEYTIPNDGNPVLFQNFYYSQPGVGSIQILGYSLEADGTAAAYKTGVFASTVKIGQ